MRRHEQLGELVEAFVNKVSHPRGTALTLLAESAVTVPQVILLDFVSRSPNCTPSDLAATMKITAPSISQMLERLVKQGMLLRAEDDKDRRRKTLKVTSEAKIFLKRLKTARCTEYTLGTAGLTALTRKALASALSNALDELQPSSQLTIENR